MENNNTIGTLVRATVATGLGASASVALCWMLSSRVQPTYLAEWKSVGLCGAAGALIGAQFALNVKPWFSGGSWLPALPALPASWSKSD
tara:strand:- start:527 stop:793 length:267 start_codon:yes stop_codon:yes gene_type:complete